MRSAEAVDEGFFYFDPDDPIYADHFPGKPVVPGSLIIEAFMAAARRAVVGQRVCRLENFRFRQFVSPGRQAYRMVVQAGGCVQCSLYTTHGRKVVTGTLYLSPFTLNLFQGSYEA